VEPSPTRERNDGIDIERASTPVQAREPVQLRERVKA
jgi:hypothetical protein